MRKMIFAAALGAASLAVLGSASNSQAALIYGLVDSNSLVSFDSATPGTIISGVALRTAANAPLQDLIGIDFRPATSQLYGVGQFGAVYTINVTTGIGTQVSQLSVGLNGSRFGFDFNPVPDRLRIASNTDQNLRTNVDTGAVTTDGTLTYAAGDINFGRNPNVVAVAYTNPDVNPATGTTIYYLDSVQNVLASATDANSGILRTIGASNIDFSSVAGFDIGADGVAYAALQEVNTGISRLYTIDLATGIATNANAIGGGDMIDGLAIAPIPEPATLGLLGGAAALLLRRRAR